MRTGFDNVTQIDNTPSDEFMKKVMSTLQVLTEFALTTAAEYVEASGRNTITSEDLRLALMYECHEFWERPELENRFTELYNEDIYADSDNDNETSSEGEKSDEDEYSKAPEINEKISKIHMYANTWSDWDPDDHIVKALKHAIDTQSFVQP